MIIVLLAQHYTHPADRPIMPIVSFFSEHVVHGWLVAGIVQKGLLGQTLFMHSYQLELLRIVIETPLVYL